MSTDTTDADTDADDSTDATTDLSGRYCRRVQTTADGEVTLPRSAYNGLKRRYRTLHDALPAPGDTWIHADLRDDLEHGDWQWLVHHKDVLLHDHGYIADHDDYPGGRTEWSSRRVWATTDALWALLEDLDGERIHPCADDGHKGVRCVEAGATYTCTTDSCDRTFGRDVAERILGGTE